MQSEETNIEMQQPTDVVPSPSPTPSPAPQTEVATSPDLAQNDYTQDLQHGGEEIILMPDQSFMTVKYEVTSGDILVSTMLFLILCFQIVKFFHQLILGRKTK